MNKPVEFVIPDWATVVENVAKELHNRIRERTPVDTGKAREGWQLEGSGEKFTILNDVPYIGILEEGTSTQAPNGMVRVSFEEVPMLLQREVDEQFEQK